MFDGQFEEPGDLNRIIYKRRDQAPVNIRRYINGNRRLEELFRLMVGRLGRFFIINRAILVLYDSESELMRLSHLQENGIIKSGLGLNIPASKSMLFQVLQQGFPVADNYPENITHNIVEKKLVVGNRSRSALVIPLIGNMVQLGVLTLSSHTEFAFGPYLEGVGEGIVADFCQKVLDNMHQMVSVLNK